ncbi:MAG: hypothetical protein OHK0039_13850 [Bacteroidia bacterium]
MKYLICLLLSGVTVRLAAQDTLYVVLLDVQHAADIAHAYTTISDAQGVVLAFAPDDSLALLSELGLDEDPLIGPECFVPDLKLIYRTHTYVVSLYCSRVLHYRNAAAFTPSSQREPNDLLITPSVQAYLQALKNRYFPGRQTNQALLLRIQNEDPAAILEEAGKDLQTLLDELQAGDLVTDPDSLEWDIEDLPLLPETEEEERR